MTPGIHLVHKAVGETSFSHVRAFMERRDAEGPAKRLPLCHGGTLDPFAEGLLLLLVGPATRLFELLHEAPKTYVAQVTWGRETDTGDAGGRTTLAGDPSGLTPAALEAALSPFHGWREQVPPATSAKKVGGEPAYRKAHRGESVELPPSRVYLNGATFRAHALPHTSELVLTVRGGFYVRALARDLGRALGCGAHLSALRRTAIGPWEDPAPGAVVQVTGAGLLPWLASRTLSDQEMGRLRAERRLPHAPLSPPAWALPRGFPAPAPLVRALHQGRLRALLRPDERDGGLTLEVDLHRGA